VQLLKAGKGKEVSYNALATHIIAEDGDNPEVGESREVFDLPVVKVNRHNIALKAGFRSQTFLVGNILTDLLPIIRCDHLLLLIKLCCNV